MFDLKGFLKESRIPLHEGNNEREILDIYKALLGVRDRVNRLSSSDKRFADLKVQASKDILAFRKTLDAMIISGKKNV